MRKYLIAFLVFVMGMTVFYMLYQYNVRSIERDSIIATMEKASETAFIASLDGSYRVTKRDMNIVSAESYESKFKDFFISNSTVRIHEDEVEYVFSYLVECSDGESVNVVDPAPYINNGDRVKGIYTEIVVRGQQYSIRYILDVSGKDAN